MAVGRRRRTAGQQSSPDTNCPCNQANVREKRDFALLGVGGGRGVERGVFGGCLGLLVCLFLLLVVEIVVFFVVVFVLLLLLCVFWGGFLGGGGGGFDFKAGSASVGRLRLRLTTYWPSGLGSAASRFLPVITALSVTLVKRNVFIRGVPISTRCI